jgi:RES domain
VATALRATYGTGTGKHNGLGGAVEEHRRSHKNRRARSVGRSCRRVRLGPSRGPSKRRWCPYRRGGTPQRRSPPVRPSRGKVVSGGCTRGAIGPRIRAAPVWCRDGTTAGSTGSPREKRSPLCTLRRDWRFAWENLPAPHARAVAIPERFPLSKLLASVQRVVDCRDPNPLSLTSGDLSHDTDYRATQALGMAADRRGLEALLVRSATGLGDNLILFPQNLLAGSRLRVVSGRDPWLYVRRD